MDWGEVTSASRWLYLLRSMQDSRETHHHIHIIKYHVEHVTAYGQSKIIGSQSSDVFERRTSTGIGLLVLLTLDIEHIFGHNFSSRVKTPSYTNLVPSRQCKREKRLTFGRRALLKNVAEDCRAIEIGCPVFIYIFPVSVIYWLEWIVPLSLKPLLFFIYFILGLCYHFNADIVQEIASLQIYPIFT